MTLINLCYIINKMMMLMLNINYVNIIHIKLTFRTVRILNTLKIMRGTS